MWKGNGQHISLQTGNKVVHIPFVSFLPVEQVNAFKWIETIYFEEIHPRFEPPEIKLFVSRNVKVLSYESNK